MKMKYVLLAVSALALAFADAEKGGAEVGYATDNYHYDQGYRTKCGDLHEQCCKNDKCRPGLICAYDGWCKECGTKGHQCCEDRLCDEGLTCNFKNKCEECGGYDQPCCQGCGQKCGTYDCNSVPDDVCGVRRNLQDDVAISGPPPRTKGHLTCVASTCVPCGNYMEPCCDVSDFVSFLYAPPPPPRGDEPLRRRMNVLPPAASPVHNTDADTDKENVHLSGGSPPKRHRSLQEDADDDVDASGRPRPPRPPPPIGTSACEPRLLCYAGHCKDPPGRNKSR